MSNSSVTLRRVFSLPEDDLPDESQEQWQTLRDKLRQEVKDVKLPAKMHDLAPKVCELFDIKIPDILLSSWKKVADIQSLLEKSRSAPEETMYVELAEHTINCEQKPYLEMSIKNMPVKKLEFNTKLFFKLKGFVLKIRNGAIREIQTGACEVKGTVSYAGQVIAEKKLSPITLPGSISLGAAADATTDKVEKETATKTLAASGA